MIEDTLAEQDVGRGVSGFSIEVDADPSVPASVSIIKDGDTSDSAKDDFSHLATRYGGKLYLSFSPASQCGLTATAVALAGRADGTDIYSGACHLHAGDEFYADLRPGRSTVAVARP